jgi:hypothetical protein
VSKAHTNGVTPISNDSWAWEGAIDEKNVSFNTIKRGCGVHKFKIDLCLLVKAKLITQTCLYFNSDSSIRDFIIIVS